MKYSNVGRSGLKVSRIGLGVMSYGNVGSRPWILPEDQGRPIIRRALEFGINFFDTANMYSAGTSEEILGRALKDFARRNEVVIATKVYFPVGSDDSPNCHGLSRKCLLSAIDASLRRLGTDYVDLYQIHRWDGETPIEETLEALNDIVRSGKARYIGASSMYAWQFSKALHVSECRGWARFISMQNHYNLVYREEEREMLPLCRSEGIGCLPWSPLARGFLAGNRCRLDGALTLRAQTDPLSQNLYGTAADFSVAECCDGLARRKEVSAAQLALAWLLQQPAVTAPIVGATKMQHLEQAVAAVDVRVTPDECAELERAYEPHRVLGHE